MSSLYPKFSVGWLFEQIRETAPEGEVITDFRGMPDRSFFFRGENGETKEHLEELSTAIAGKGNTTDRFKNNSVSARVLELAGVSTTLEDYLGRYGHHPIPENSSYLPDHTVIVWTNYRIIAMSSSRLAAIPLDPSKVPVEPCNFGRGIRLASHRGG